MPTLTGSKTPHPQLSNMAVAQLLSHIQLLQPHGLQPARFLCPWDSPGKKTGVGCHFLLQGIFRTQGLNLGLLQTLYLLTMRENLVWCPCLFFYLNFRGEVIPQLGRKQLRILCTRHAGVVFTVTQPVVHTHLSIRSRQPSRKEGESRQGYWRCCSLRN